MRLGDGDGSTHLPKRIHGQLTMAPYSSMYASLSLFSILLPPSQLIGLIAAPAPHLVIVHLLKKKSCSLLVSCITVDCR